MESAGPTTIRVGWRSPPIENWNGDIKGYYLGYRKSSKSGGGGDVPYVYTYVPVTQQNPAQASSSFGGGGHIHPTSSSSPPNFKREITAHETFIRKLEPATEYSIVIKAVNSAGSGPLSHEILGRTADNGGEHLPSVSLALSVLDTTEDTISVRWHPKMISYQQQSNQHPGSQITSYSIHYQAAGETKWREVSIVPPPPAVSPSLDPNSNGNQQQQQQQQQQAHHHHFTSFSYVLENLEPNVLYRVYVCAVNRYGSGDPSNVAAVRTVSGKFGDDDKLIRFKNPSYLPNPCQD